MVFKIICGILGIAFGIYLIIIRWKKHKNIDTRGIATVKEVRKLGFDEGSKAYAIFYDVGEGEDAFELCHTPVRKRERIGKKKVIFYCSKEPKKNYYFQSIGSFDQRLIFPWVLTICGVVVLTNFIVSLF